ncbi:BofC C-terminal domain-containing protein [Aquibacillus halophilus]|nr:BofC C-terminal domain-containing protein [Aquibacillus halophilus]
MKRHLILLIMSLAIVFGGLGISSLVLADNKDEGQSDQEENVLREPLEMEVTLQRHYIDGKFEENTHTETIGAMEDFWSYYHGWQVIDQKEGKIVFRKEIPDISPYLKEKGYFGLKNDILTIFNGRPTHEQVIQSFYQIDTSELESYQAKQLQDGIKIETKEVYQYVLEAFRDMTPSRSVSN